MSPARRFLAYCLASAATAVVATGTFTLSVDPYAVWGIPRIDGFNAVKPEIYTHAVPAKIAQARRLAPRGVILGNSRMDVGLDPKSRWWPAEARPVFNLAIPGLGPGSNLMNLERVFKGRPAPLVVVMGVDFPDFLMHRSSRTSIPKLAPPHESIAEKLHDVMSTTLSISALIDAVNTLRAQDDKYASNMTTQGLDTMRQYLGFVRMEGHYNLFYQRTLENIRMQLRGGKSVVDSDGRPSTAFYELSAVIDWCRLHKATLYLLIYPYHAELLNSFQLTGVWPAFETWKRMLVQMITDEKDKLGYKGITLWDFSGYNEFTIEEVPPKGDHKTGMRWYWEAGHFKSSLGELMLRRIFGKASPADFGVQLDLTTIETQIANLRTQAADYRATHLNDVARLEEIYRQVSPRATPIGP